MIRYTVTALSGLLCVAAATATWAILATVVYVGGFGSAGYMVIVGLWSSVPYGMLAALAGLQRRRFATSVIVLVGTMAICGFSTFMFYQWERPFFAPQTAGTPQVMNCAGPILELGLPIVQMVAIGVLGIAAAGFGFAQDYFTRHNMEVRQSPLLK